MEKRTDFLVIGSGIAGLTYALKASKFGKVIVLSKNTINETNTKYAQGGIAAVTYGPDNFEKHIKDTVVAGVGYSDPDVVRMVIEEAPRQIQQLIDWGVEFDKDNTGKYDLAREGGHSEFRILHRKDFTGKEIQRALVEKVRKTENIEVIENEFALDLITQHHMGKMVKRYHTDIECFGAYSFNLKTNIVQTILSKVTVVATGGAGQAYLTTTNPEIATGDGIAMVYRAKGIIENMEFIQFHPTALYNPGESPAFLITEAMRGYGAILRTQNGHEFMHKYDERGCLAPRDVVARAIDNEMKLLGHDFVYLDCTHKDAEETKSHFPNIYEKCKSLGIDITKDYIPVIPAAHYSCGGIKVDMHGRTNIKRLYAIGEASSTGLHGANRLASNSLMEAVVYAERASRNAIPTLHNIQYIDNIPIWNDKGTTDTEEMVLVTQSFKELQMIMSNYVGIVRSDLRLERALKRLEIIHQETETLYKKSKLSKQLCELRNLINVGYLIIKLARQREESIGLHYTISYPEKKSIGEF